MSAAANPWLDRRFFHWAHQGGARENPSNTLRAMREARTVGAHGLEFDVHATSDDVLVLAHDRSLKRMTGDPRKICDLSLHEVQQLDAAHNWVPGEVDVQGAPDESMYQLRHRGPGPVDETLTLPTLESILVEFADMPVNIELKAPGYEQTLADILAKHGRTDDVIVVAFNGRTLSRFRKLAPSVPVAPGRLFVGLFWLLSRIGIALANPGYVALQVPDRMFGIQVTDKRLVDKAHSRGLAVHVWTVDDRDRMVAAVATGADGIMTDRPSVLAALLAERGIGWSKR